MVPPVAGILLGYALVSAVVVGGFAALVNEFPAALLVTTVAGASYLAYLGVKVLRSPAQIAHAGGEAQRPSTARSFGRGVGVSALNPKGLLILASVTQGFTRPDAELPLTAQLAVLCALYIAICAVVYLPLGLAADRVLGARPGLLQLVQDRVGQHLPVREVPLRTQVVVRGREGRFGQDSVEHLEGLGGHLPADPVARDDGEPGSGAQPVGTAAGVV